MSKKRLVVDSSVIVKWINHQDEKLLDKADAILHQARKGNLELISPELAKYEVGSALLYKGMELPAAIESLNLVYDLPIQFIPISVNQASETMEIAFRCHMSYYDASFLSLAKQQQASVVTDNPKHQKKFTDVKVIALADYH